MSTIKNGQISLNYHFNNYHFNKTIKDSGTSFHSAVMGQKRARNVCHTAHQYLTKFNFNSTQDLKETSM